MSAKRLHIEKLAKLVAEEIETIPHKRGGFSWAARPQDWYCAKSGVPLRTFQRLIKAPPFVSEQGEVDGVKRSLLRLASPDDAPKKTAQHLANIMRKIWREKVGREVGRKQHGCLIGLADIWPDGSQLAIFKAVLDDWPAYMTGVKLAQEEMKLNGEKVVRRYYRFPSITVLRRFPSIAIELYGMKLQESGKPIPKTVADQYFASSGLLQSPSA